MIAEKRTLTDTIAKVLITEDQLQARIAELARELSQIYSVEDRPILVGILKGSIMFLADLTRHLEFPHELDFMETSRYGRGTEGHGKARILLDLEQSITGRHVLIVEDIIDVGETMAAILSLLRTRHPASLRVCTLLDKPSRRTVPVQIDFVGFEVPDEFVVGYGLDYDELYRDLPFIGVLKPDVYNSKKDSGSG